MSIKTILIFASGVVTGAAIGILAVKQKLEKKYDERYAQQIADMEAYYGRTDQYVRTPTETNYDGDSGNPEPMTEEERAAAKERLREGYQNNRVDYASMYRKDDQQEEENESEPEVDEGFEAHQDYQKNKDRPPRIISAEAVGEVPQYYDNQIWFYYSYDGVIASDDGEVIDDPERFVGDCLDRYDFRGSDEEFLFVQSFEHSTIYEIQKIKATYSDEVEMTERRLIL